MIKNKNQNAITFRVLLSILAVFGFVITGFSCQSQVNALTSDIAKWYSTDQQLSEGEIVSIKSDRGDYVESAKSGVPTQILGVVVPDGQALASIDENKNGVQVAIAGRAQAKVNLSNGPIARGDLVGLSDVTGVGARANDGQPVVGIAEASFDQNNIVSSDKTGLLPIIISVGVAPSANGAASTTSTTWLKSIAGNNVTALQLTFVLFIAVVGLTSIVVLTYASLKNGIISVGRNPLARPAILSALAQAMVMVAIVAISSFSLMYFILRL